MHHSEKEKVRASKIEKNSIFLFLWLKNSDILVKNLKKIEKWRNKFSKKEII